MSILRPFSKSKTRRGFGNDSAEPAEALAAAGGGVFTRRALLMMGVQTGVLGLLADRLYDLQLLKGAPLKEQARRNRTSRRLLAPPRGLIQDRFGVTLAGNRINWRALLMPEETTDVDAVIAHFATIVPLDEHDQARIARDRKHLRRYVPLTLKEFLSWEDMSRLGLNAPSLPGVLVDVGTTREYPFNGLMAHIVGYVAPPNEKDVQKNATLALPGMRVGRAGLEQTQEGLLHGQPGSVEMEVNAVGRVIGELDRLDGAPGAKLGLTIDSVLQKQVCDRLGERVASAVVMDCRNGEIMAMVSTPSFDPTLFDSGVSHTQWKTWNEDPRTPLVDKAVSGLYPPGSTFKPAVALAALSSGAITASDRFSCPGHYDLGGVRFHCWNKYGHGSLNLHGGLKFSCDVYFYQVARRCGMEAIEKASHMLGMGVKLPVELPHVRSGVIPTPEWRRAHGHHWNAGDTVNAGIGQGFVQVTPLALACYASSIASGRATRPHLLRSLEDRLLPGASTDPAANLGADPAMSGEGGDNNGLLFSEAHLSAVRGGMYAVVNEAHGTAPKARLSIPGVQMAGKTGSAQVRRVSRALRESGHFNSMSLPWEYRPHALFICYAPYDNPRYAVSVIVEHGNAGATEAAPLARQIMTDTLMRDPANRAPLTKGVVARAALSPEDIPGFR
ncbi:penicillin-binding protein 2 [Oecophyllibacter saccharovorans]|uniref:penicillin-binding protein 2 n=1 Tax=Oecophyllibacter saccharovorans TaxID=2558360 RepID=UPI00114514AA|nr:penicillin-binding protein 2 [Oecophyllibacter saccharovorans]QDH15618.1 penicillin-binding protein 2 [Oecophyllibacter saccharovorans]